MAVKGMLGAQLCACLAALAVCAQASALDLHSLEPAGGLARTGRMLQQAAGSPGNGSLIEDFVARSGTRFVVQSRNGSKGDCETFYFSGANANYMMVRAADPDMRWQVTEILDTAKSMGLKVIRTWAFSDGPLQYNALQRYPGVYDEATRVGMDYVIQQASQRGIRLVLVLANYWAMYGGIDQYNIWSFQAGSGTCNGDTTCRDDFYSDPVAVGYYKDHVKMWLNRRNTFTGRLYREDPTIFGYNLMNEPRSQSELYLVRRQTTDGSRMYNISYNPGDDLQHWIEDMAVYVKSMDPIHLLSTGQEGFAGNSTPLYMYSNPGAWASLMGVDYVRNNKAKGIDYSTMHVYTDQWLCVAEGATTQGQLDFMKQWIEARIQAAEEELEMPVVLEEFGSKLDKRPGQFQTAYDTCLASARRGGACAGVMFWDVVHHGFADVDPWLDGTLRFGGGYSTWSPPSSPVMAEVIARATNFSRQVELINAASGGADTCVFVPPPQMGLGCKDLAINLDEGGMPWTCLPGEPANVNWCNGAGGADLYRNPPAAWRGARTQGLPYNSIEVLVLGNLTNTGTKPLNLKGSWIIVPFSMGVHTQFEGVWKRQTQPNSYFKVFCWYLGASGSGSDLCSNGAVHISFTNFSWPVGVKRDRGLNITFVQDVILPPGGVVLGANPGAAGASTSVAISFKDDTNHFRLDVSSLGLQGSTNCPSDPVLSSWPPPPPPPPRPCTAGPDPRRGCPALEWYWRNQTASSPVETSSIRTASIDAPAPAQGAAGRHLLQVGGTTQTSGGGEGPHAPPPFGGGPIAKVINSQSANVDVGSLPLTRNEQWILTANVRVAGTIRRPQPRVAPGEPMPKTTDKMLAAFDAKGVMVSITLRYTRPGLSAPTYLVIAMGQVVAGANGWTPLRGVFMLKDIDDLKGAVIFADAPHPGLTVTLDKPLFYGAANLSSSTVVPTLPANITDVYQPCSLPPDHGHTAVYAVTLPAGRNDVLSAELCSHGGYDQILRVYADGALVARTDRNNQPSAYNVTVPVKGGSRVILALTGSIGEPYGGYRGQPGLRLRWRSGQAYDGLYDAAPTSVNATQFVRVHDGDLVIDCKRAAYVGVNTWDLMDKARYVYNREEVSARLDAMVKAGWGVGRTWGFSLGDGLTNGIMGTTVADKNKILETGPGTYNEEVFAALDWVLDQASRRGLRIIIPFEDYWLSIDRFVNWSDTASGKNDFYSDYKIKQMYKAHLRTFTSRVNTINGRKYSEDPTIYYWNLLNEPRCTGCGTLLQQWLEEMSVFLKAIDPNHLVTLGAEGFYSTTCERVFLNPGAGKRRTGIASSPWAAQEGQDFLANHVVPSIDLVTTHIWADNWMGYADYAGSTIDDGFDYTHGRDLWVEKLDYTKNWLAAHISDAQALGKPLVIEEFGKAHDAAKLYTDPLPHPLQPGETVAKGNAIRDQFYKAVYEQIQDNALQNGVAQGSNFWNLYTVGTGANDPYQVTLADTSTMDVVNAHMHNMSSIIGVAAPQGCTVNSTVTGAVPFPGFAAGNWTGPPPLPTALTPGSFGAGPAVGGANGTGNSSSPSPSS